MILECFGSTEFAILFWGCLCSCMLAPCFIVALLPLTPVITLLVMLCITLIIPPVIFLGLIIVLFVAVGAISPKKKETKKERPESQKKKEMLEEILTKKAPKPPIPGPILLGGLALSVVIIGIFLNR